MFVPLDQVAKVPIIHKISCDADSYHSDNSGESITEEFIIGRRRQRDYYNRTYAE